MVLKIPVPAPATIPVGPYRLSIHPTSGSLADEVTIAGRKIPIGRFTPFRRMMSSAKAFVNVYVLGHSPIMLIGKGENVLKGTIDFGDLD